MAEIQAGPDQRRSDAGRRRTAEDRPLRGADDPSERARDGRIGGAVRDRHVERPDPDRQARRAALPLPVQDLFDVAVARREDRRALKIAVNACSNDLTGSTVLKWLEAGDGYREDATEGSPRHAGAVCGYLRAGGRARGAGPQGRATGPWTSSGAAPTASPPERRPWTGRCAARRPTRRRARRCSTTSKSTACAHGSITRGRGVSSAASRRRVTGASLRCTRKRHPCGGWLTARTRERRRRNPPGSQQRERGPPGPEQSPPLTVPLSPALRGRRGGTRGPREPCKAQVAWSPSGDAQPTLDDDAWAERVREFCRLPRDAIVADGIDGHPPDEPEQRERRRARGGTVSAGACGTPGPPREHEFRSGVVDDTGSIRGPLSLRHPAVRAAADLSSTGALSSALSRPQAARGWRTVGRHAQSPGSSRSGHVPSPSRSAARPPV